MKIETGNNQNNWTEQEKEIIRQKAYILWKKDANQSNDQHYWHEAEKDFEVKKLSRFHPYRWYFWLEKHTLEPFLSFIKRRSLTEISTIMAIIGSLASLWLYIQGEEERYYEKIYKAILDITNENLNKVPLIAVKAAESLNSSSLQFPWITLEKDNPADWTEDFSSSSTKCKKKARLLGFHLDKRRDRPVLIFLNLKNAQLPGVRLCSAYIQNSNLQGVEFSFAALDGSGFIGSNLNNAKLIGTSLQETNFLSADLSGANLQEANLRGADLNGAILEGVKNLTNTQIKSACFWDKAVYKVEKTYNPKTKEWFWKAKEPENQQHIDKIRQDKTSDPQTPPDCSKWPS